MHPHIPDKVNPKHSIELLACNQFSFSMQLAEYGCVLILAISSIGENWENAEDLYVEDFGGPLDSNDYCYQVSTALKRACGLEVLLSCNILTLDLDACVSVKTG